MKVLVLTPSKGSISLEHRDMLLHLGALLKDAGHKLSMGDDTTNGMLAHSRNVLITMLDAHKPDWGLWIDSDTSLRATAVMDMLGRSEELIVWNYPVRWPWDIQYPPERVRRAKVVRRWVGSAKLSGGLPSTSSDGRLVELTQCGFGALLMRPSVAAALAPDNIAPLDWVGRRTIKAFDNLDEQYRFGEDYSFCKRWTRKGGRIWCDPTPYVTNGQTGGCFSDELKRTAKLAQMCRLFLT